MKDRLPVRSDEINLRNRHAPSLARIEGGSRKLLAEFEIQCAQFAGCSRLAVRHSQNRDAQSRGERSEMMPLKFR
jgi:hypothetical protein